MHLHTKQTIAALVETQHVATLYFVRHLVCRTYVLRLAGIEPTGFSISSKITWSMYFLFVHGMWKCLSLNFQQPAMLSSECRNLVWQTRVFDTRCTLAEHSVCSDPLSLIWTNRNICRRSWSSQRCSVEVQASSRALENALCWSALLARDSPTHRLCRALRTFGALFSNRHSQCVLNC